ncbi:hypothetical protein [Pseudorhodoferax sp. Leaf267]|uniref:hypothetical protein n=1 Tax=Pseudorhodoferax sp. Leaf267 TaxID=1736316 RepID=UPI0006FF65B0|nr:hypothetical protein [Pseudorhodoferax sp. Leaf267]KQP15079.1 hypothetical protein ASF43_13660 [Pseudorhodoferax sp. Leaf267]
MRHLRHPLAIAALLLGASAFAQQPPPPAPAAPPPAGMAAPADASAAAPVAAGKVQRWLLNPNGEVDGFLLADGTQVAFAPHLSAALLQAVKLGDAVQVSGWRTPNLPNVRVVRAASVQASASGRSVVDTPPVPGARAPRESGALTAMSASGRVAQVLYTDRGDANGVLLDSGSIVRFGPRRGAALLPSLQVGSTVHARGWGSRGEQGSALEATAIGPTADTMQELFAGPGQQPGPPGGPRGPRGPRGPQPPMAGQPMPPPPAS